MRNKILIIIISTVLLGISSGCTSQQARAKKGKIDKLAASTSGRDIVKSVDFTGNRNYENKTLQKKLGFQRGDYIDPVLAEAYRLTLTEFYHNKGFAFAEVSLDSDKLQQGNVLYIIDEGPRVRITSVKISGNQSVKSRSLRRVIKTKARKWLVRPTYYTEEKVAEDVEKLKNAYYDKGFLNNNIKQQLDFSDNRRRVGITFAIDEGPVYTVNEIIFTGNQHFDTNELTEGIKLQPGQVYRKRLADSHTKRLRQLYREHGYIDARVQQRPGFIADADAVNMEFDIAEGRRFRIGRIDITGNTQTQDRVIRRVLDEVDFSPGQLYNAHIAPREGDGQLEKDVRAMTMAEEVIIRPVGEPYTYDSNETGLLGQDAHVAIKEGQTGMIMVGGGVSSDSAVVGQFVYQQRNFDISDRPDSLKDLLRGKGFKGAGQTLKIALQPGTEVSQYSISFTEPYLKDKPTSLNVVGSSWMRGRECYDEERIKGFLELEKRYKNEWRRSIGLRAESVDVGSIDTDAPKEITDVKGNNSLMGVRLGTGKNSTDDRFNPSSGYSFDAGYEQVFGDYTFGVLSAVYRRYKTIHEDLAEQKTILATKFLGATTIGDAPPFEKFYAGGTGLHGIRGFDYRGVSTRGMQTNVANPERKDPIGSNWIFIASGEVTVPLTSEEFALLLFIDSGAIDSGGYRAAAGIGVQVMIPQWFGPVPMRFELATPFMKNGDDETRVFSFSVGALF